jgi:hypothetical protein
MGIIKVETPQGIKEVEIAGDTPTEQEQQALFNTFFAETPQAQTDLDFSTASIEEIQNYARQKELAGIDAATGQPIDPTTQPVGDLKDPDVDYTSGVKDFGLRTKLGTFELPEEKAAYLEDRVGKEGFRQDKGGRFILTKRGRAMLGMEEGPEIAIDEEGFSRYDLADFAGEGGASLATGIGAGVLLSGVGTIPAAIGVGVTMGVTKLIDEAFEEAAGYQRQTKEEQIRSALFEGALGFAGEGVGRAISSLFGRIIKGGGVGPEAELARQQGRALREQGFKPLFEGAAPGVRPILNRIQAVAEGVFPNRAAANKNIDIAVAQLRELNSNMAAIDGLEQAMKEGIKDLYTSSGQKVRDAQKVLSTEVETRIKNIMAPLTKTGTLSKDSVKSLIQAKNIFDRESDKLFSAANNALGKNNEIIPIEKIRKALKEIERTSPKANQIKESQIEDLLRAAETRAGARISKRLEAMRSQGNILGKIDQQEIDRMILREAHLTPEEANLLRKILKNLEYSPEFIGTISGTNKAIFKKSIDDAFLQGEENLSMALNYFERGNLDLPSTQQQFRSFLESQGLNVEGEVTKDTINRIREGFNLLGRSRDFYGKGASRLDDPIIEQLFQKTKQGSIDIDTDAFFDAIVQNNSPKKLNRFLKAIRSVPELTSLEVGEATLKKQKVVFQGRELTVDEANRVLEQLPENSTTRAFAKRIQAAERAQADVAEVSKFGAEAAENLRQKLASSFLSRQLKNPNNYSTTKDGVRVLDGIKLAKSFDDLGTTRNVLFKGQQAEINNLINVLRQTGAEFDEDIVNQLSGDSIIDAVQNLSTQAANRKALDFNQVVQSLNNNDAEGIISTLFQRGNAGRINSFKQGTLRIGDNQLSDYGNFSPQLIEKVEDAAMSRILRSLGDFNSPKFREDFLSGSIGRNLRSTLDGYGEEAVNAMFGKEVGDKLFQLADNMISVSNASIAGKGGLAAPNIALGLGLFSIISSPLGTLPTAAGFLAFSKLMRSGPILDIMLASRKPGADKLGQAFQIIQSTTSKVEGEALAGGTQPQGDRTIPFPTDIRPSGEGPFKLSPEMKRTVKDAAMNIAPPSAASSAGGVSPLGTNPIVNPNPTTQALAQALQGKI